MLTIISHGGLIQYLILNFMKTNIDNYLLHLSWEKKDKTFSLIYFKSQINCMLWSPSCLFAFTPISSTLPVAIRYWSQEFNLLFHTKAMFSNIETTLPFTP